MCVNIQHMKSENKIKIDSLERMPFEQPYRVYMIMILISVNILKSLCSFLQFDMEFNFPLSTSFYVYV